MQQRFSSRLSPNRDVSPPPPPPPSRTYELDRSPRTARSIRRSNLMEREQQQQQQQQREGGEEEEEQKEMQPSIAGRTRRTSGTRQYVSSLGRPNPVTGTEGRYILIKEQSDKDYECKDPQGCFVKIQPKKDPHPCSVVAIHLIDLNNMSGSERNLFNTIFVKHKQDVVDNLCRFSIGEEYLDKIAHDRSPEYNHYLLAKADMRSGKCCGFILFSIHRKKKELHLSLICTLEKSEIGKELMTRLEYVAGKSGVKRIYMEALPSAVPFYLGMGYKYTSTANLPHGEFAYIRGIDLEKVFA